MEKAAPMPTMRLNTGPPIEPAAAMLPRSTNRKSKVEQQVKQGPARVHARMLLRALTAERRPSQS
jgi:hypothetical protein